MNAPSLLIYLYSLRLESEMCLGLFEKEYWKSLTGSSPLEKERNEDMNRLQENALITTSSTWSTLRLLPSYKTYTHELTGFY